MFLRTKQFLVFLTSFGTISAYGSRRASLFCCSRFRYIDRKLSDVVESIDNLKYDLSMFRVGSLGLEQMDDLITHDSDINLSCAFASQNI